MEGTTAPTTSPVVEELTDQISVVCCEEHPDRTATHRVLCKCPYCGNIIAFLCMPCAKRELRVLAVNPITVIHIKCEKKIPSSNVSIKPL